MKPKTKAFADKLLENPKLSQTEAYLQTHETESRATARNNASSLLAQPNVLEYLQSKSEIAEKALFNVLQTSKKHKDNVNWQRLAKDTANDVLDRAVGKPLARTSSLNISVSIEQALNSLE